MGVYALGDSNLAAVASREFSRQTLHFSYHRSRVWFMSLICDLGSAEAFLAGILPVAATAPPPVRFDRHRITVPRSFTSRRVRRKTTKWGSDDGDEGYEWAFDGNGGYGGMDGGYGFGGGDSGRGWSYGRGHDGWDGGHMDDDKVVWFVYQVACWISLSHCLHFALKKAPNLVKYGVKSSSPEAVTTAASSPPFANC